MKSREKKGNMVHSQRGTPEQTQRPAIHELVSLKMKIARGGRQLLRRGSFEGWRGGLCYEERDYGGEGPVQN